MPMNPGASPHWGISTLCAAPSGLPSTARRRMAMRFARLPSSQSATHACLHAQRGHRHRAVVQQGVQDGKPAPQSPLANPETTGVHVPARGLSHRRHRQAVATGLFE